MPYVPLSDGQLIFVETQEEADRLYNESWGQGAAAEAQPAAPQQPAPAWAGVPSAMPGRSTAESNWHKTVYRGKHEGRPRS